MANTTTTEIPAEVNNFYDKTLLTRAVPYFVHTKWAQVRNIPRKGGTKTIKFRRYGNLVAATTPLTEGVTPTGSQLSITDITATVADYGDYVTITDVLDYQSMDPVLTETAEILGDQAGDTLDQICRDILVAGTNVYYGGTAVSRVTVAAADLITAVLIQKVVRTLKNGIARKVTRMVDADTGISTTPLNACYIGIVHPNVSFTLKGLSGFLPVEKYSRTQGIMDMEIGMMEEVRFIETTNAKVFTGAGAAGIDVYATLILGMDAYATSAINGQAMMNIVKPLGSAGTADPLNQRATSGWKANFVAKILNNNYMVRVETSAAA